MGLILFSGAGRSGCLGRVRPRGRRHQHGRVEEADDAGGSDATRRGSPTATQGQTVQVHSGTIFIKLLFRYIHFTVKVSKCQAFFV
jgi:hypothetical protein